MKKLVILGIDHPHCREIIRAAKERDDIQISAIAQETPPYADVLADELKVKCYMNYLECLDREQPDIVGVSMYNGGRGKVILEALRRGIAVIADKPLCTTLDEISAIKEEWRKRRTPLAMMLTCRCNPVYRAIREVVAEGLIGKTVSVKGFRYYALNRAARPDWMFHRTSYGGPALDILIHDYDLARWITGLNWSRAEIAEWRSGRFADTDFNDIAALKGFDDGALLDLSMSWHSPKYHRDSFTVYGDAGFIEKSSFDNRLFRTDSTGERIEVPLQNNDSYFSRQFFSALLDGGEYQISPEESIDICHNILNNLEAMR